MWRACEQIDGLTGNGKLPVVVGGTQLYIELLLWESAVDFYTTHQQQQSAASLLASRTTNLAETRNSAATCSVKIDSREESDIFFLWPTGKNAFKLCSGFFHSLV